MVEPEPSPGPELDPEEPPPEELSAEPSRPEPVEVLPLLPLPSDVGWATAGASSEPSLLLPDEPSPEDVPGSPAASREPEVAEPDSPEPLLRLRECPGSAWRTLRSARASLVVAARAVSAGAAAGRT